MYERENVDNKSSILSGITTPYIKHVPIIPIGAEHKYIQKMCQFFLLVYLITENSKVYKPNSHTKLKLKVKDLNPSYQEITSILVST